MTQKLKYNLTRLVMGAFTTIVLVGAVVLIFNYAHPAYAVSTTTTTAGDAGGFVPCGNTATNPCQIGHLFSAFVVIINYLIAMAGFIAVIAIVFAGFQMVYSQSEGNLKEAKGRLSGAVVGLVLVAAAFVIINTLFSGSLSIGVQDGANILSSPLEYINGGKSSSTSPASTTNTPKNNNTAKPTNTNTAPIKAPTKK